MTKKKNLQSPTAQSPTKEERPLAEVFRELDRRRAKKKSPGAWARKGQWDEAVA
ncbi:MAG: hypothetical protein WC531_01930 [Candidatus Paceibacterota bacterium]